MAPLHHAAVYGEAAKVTALLDRDPTLVNASDEHGFTALHGVVGEHHLAVARLLIARGANVNARDFDGATPLHFAAYPEVLDLLLEAGAELESRTTMGYTALHSHAERPDSKAVLERLLTVGADPNSRTNDGTTPLDIALSRGEHEKIELLQAFGACNGKDVA